MSTNKIAITAATRPCSPRGVPIPIRHDEPEIEAASMNQETLQDIRVSVCTLFDGVAVKEIEGRV